MQVFNYHSHTYRCGHADLDMKDEEYIKEYIKMGFKRMAFTDHCPEKNEIDKRDDMRMKYEQRKEYLESIQILKEKYSGQIEIQSGYEVEYLPGEEENLKELKAEEIGKLSVFLGGGRIRKEDKIDSAVGITLNKKVGDKVEKSDIVAYIHSNDEEKGKEAVQRLKKIYIIK